MGIVVIILILAWVAHCCEVEKRLKRIEELLDKAVKHDE